MKKCSKCKKTKRSDRFRPDKTRKDGLYSWCTACCKNEQRSYYERNREKVIAKCKAYNRQNPEVQKAALKKWQQNNPDAVARHRLKHRFNLSLEEYNQRLSDQDFRCRICNEKSDQRLAVDHNHVTKELRGLLCTRCNVGLGYFLEDIDRLESAIKYLKEYT